jgi:ParB family chromosome partitioning protein
VLEQVMLGRTDDLSTEAAKLLAGVRGVPAVARAALSAAHEPLRLQAVAWLAAEYDASADAKSHLRAALDSRYFRVREAAANELATKRDPAAFDALVRLLAAAATRPSSGRRSPRSTASATRARRTPCSTGWRTTRPAPPWPTT